MKLSHILVLTGALVLSACSSSSSSDGSGAAGSSGNNNNTPSPSTNSDEVTAAQGGMVELDDGASVTIPAGALSEDTEITVESSEPSSDLPDFASIQGLVYDFGPDGTMFADPVELTLPLVGTPGADEEAVVSWLDEANSRWEDVPTTVSGDTVVAEVTHFTMFVVRFKGVAAGAVTCDFTACTGGDIVGTWNILGVCVDIPNPFEATCAEATFNVDSNMEGTVTFNDDGTYSSAITTGGSFNFTMPASCLEQLTQGQTASCQDIFGEAASDGGAGTTCTGDSTTGCECTAAQETKNETDMGTYSISGSQITMQGETDSVPTVAPLCISGNSLKVQSVEQEGDGGASLTFLWSAQRQP